MINYTVDTATKLHKAWTCGDYYEKQSFQNMLFPNGLAYDSKMEHYRTPKVNSVFGCIAYLSKLLKENKKGDSQFLLDKSPTVPSAGLEPARFPTGV